MTAVVDGTLPVTDLAEQVMFTDPFPRYAELRRTAPVSVARHRETRNMTSYMLTRYEDVQTLQTRGSRATLSSTPGRAG
jgi:hypothetical protein